MEEFNQIQIIEENGITTIKIDGTNIKGLLDYTLKKDANNVLINLNISVPPRNLRTVY